MTRLGSEQVALFVRTHGGELTRIWREARAIARAEVFPGLIDGVVESFFEACGELLPADGTPEDVWTMLHGVVRWPPAAVPGEIHREWALLGEVVTAACEAVHCDEAVSEWLARAAAFCRHAMAGSTEDRDQWPPGVLATIVFSPFVPRRTRPERRETDA